MSDNVLKFERPEKEPTQSHQDVAADLLNRLAMAFMADDTEEESILIVKVNKEHAITIQAVGPAFDEGALAVGALSLAKDIMTRNVLARSVTRR